MTHCGFLDPGFLSSALYTLEEANEVLSLIHLELRPDDLRARGVEARDKMDKELAQVVFMAFSCLVHCGSRFVTVEYDRKDPKFSNLVIGLQMVEDALEMVRHANKGSVRSVEMHATEVIAWAYLLADRYNADLSKALWVWLTSIQEKASGTRN
jgi:NTP pyrophosphatase (non-canonical NTP hydrolase)